MQSRSELRDVLAENNLDANDDLAKKDAQSRGAFDVDSIDFNETDPDYIPDSSLDPELLKDLEEIS